VNGQLGEQAYVTHVVSEGPFVTTRTLSHSYQQLPGTSIRYVTQLAANAPHSLHNQHQSPSRQPQNRIRVINRSVSANAPRDVRIGKKVQHVTYQQPGNMQLHQTTYQQPGNMQLHQTTYQQPGNMQLHQTTYQQPGNMQLQHTTYQQPGNMQLQHTTYQQPGNMQLQHTTYQQPGNNQMQMRAYQEHTDSYATIGQPVKLSNEAYVSMDRNVITKPKSVLPADDNNQPIQVSGDKFIRSRLNLEESPLSQQSRSLVIRRSGSRGGTRKRFEYPSGYTMTPRFSEGVESYLPVATAGAQQPLHSTGGMTVVRNTVTEQPGDSGSSTTRQTVRRSYHQVASMEGLKTEDIHKAMGQLSWEMLPKGYTHYILIIVYACSTVGLRVYLVTAMLSF